MKFHALFLSAALVSSLCYGQYRCVENGKTLITDKPCASTPAMPEAKATNSFSDAKNSAYSTNYGAWRGQVQFMAKSVTDVVNEAQAMVPVVLEIDPQGKVTGISTETGCTFKGIALPGGPDILTNLDITLTKCNLLPSPPST